MINESLRNEYEKRARDLVSQMTLEEKVSQMLHDAPAIPRLGIPAYNWWNEALHGVARAGIATMFPQAIGLAATFDSELLNEIGTVVSTEARGKYNMQKEFGDTDIYKGLTLWCPNVNIFRDPRWGRGHETYGEDPYLTSRLGVSYATGLQGNDEQFLKTAACAKHFAVHSGPESVRHEFNAEVGKKDLYETYLPAFEALVKEANIETVMGAYNRVNGEPCCASKTLLGDILRGDWGFQGHVTSDCWAIKDIYQGHGVCSSAIESVALAVENGCDVNCGNIFVYLVQAVEEGLIAEEKIDQACIRLFTTRMKLGMFEEPGTVPFDAITYAQVDTRENTAFNKEVSRKTLVLLKNQNQILPLKKENLKTVGVIGPNADSRKALVGNYEGTASRYITVLEGIQDYLGEDVRVRVSEGCDLFKDRSQNLARPKDRMSEVKAVCRESDVIIVALGLDAGLEGEEGDTGNEFASGDKPNLDLPGLQNEVLETAASFGKPVILLLLSGSALAVNWADENVDAIMQCWYPGSQGGKAIAEVLFGESAPEGKLPITFYRSTEELPDFEDYRMEGRTYRYMTGEALYPFGYGLSYTTFAVENLKTEKTEDADGIGLTVSCTVTNTGAMAARATIETYVKAETPGAPNPQLKGFAKTKLLAPGETQEVTIVLPHKAFTLVNEEGQFCDPQCTFTVYVGESQPDNRSCKLMGKVPLSTTIVL